MNRIDESLILSERQLAILRVVVETYIATAQPVGSSVIAESPEIHASPATVRNEMMRLEDIGLLLQPHTSAGRIPTDLGYRYYIDYLLGQYNALRAHANVPSPTEPGIEAACRLLGELTRYTALAFVPGWDTHRLLHLEIALVGHDQLLVMLVTDNNQVLHSLTTMHERPQPARLRQLNDVLNARFAGKLLSALTLEAITAAVVQLPHPPDAITRHAPDLVRRGLEEGRGLHRRMYVEGTTHIFEHQEFAQMPKLRALMEALQEESVFETLFARTRPGELQVSIGAENPHPGLEDCAIVFTSYQVSGEAMGRVGVLGPKRMPYRNIIRTLDAVVHNLDQRLQAHQER